MDVNNSVSELQGRTQPPAEASSKPEPRIEEELVKVKAAEQPSIREVIENKNKRSVEALDIIKEVFNINNHFNVMQSSLQLTIDSASGRNVITVSDKTSGDLIRKIPGDEVLAMSARIRQYMESMQIQMQMQGKGGLDLKGLLFEGKG